MHLLQHARRGMRDPDFAATFAAAVLVFAASVADEATPMYWHPYYGSRSLPPDAFLGALLAVGLLRRWPYVWGVSLVLMACQGVGYLVSVFDRLVGLHPAGGPSGWGAVGAGVFSGVVVLLLCSARVQRFRARAPEPGPPRGFEMFAVLLGLLSLAAAVGLAHGMRSATDTVYYVLRCVGFGALAAASATTAFALWRLPAWTLRALGAWAVVAFALVVMWVTADAVRTRAGDPAVAVLFLVVLMGIPTGVIVLVLRYVYRHLPPALREI